MCSSFGLKPCLEQLFQTIGTYAWPFAVSSDFLYPAGGMFDILTAG
jgi:uncharacterized protein